jgi:hypothetical protein
VDQNCGQPENRRFPEGMTERKARATANASPKLF